MTRGSEAYSLITREIVIRSRSALLGGERLLHRRGPSNAWCAWFIGKKRWLLTTTAARNIGGSVTLNFFFRVTKKILGRKKKARSSAKMLRMDLNRIPRIGPLCEG